MGKGSEIEKENETREAIACTKLITGERKSVLNVTTS